MASSPSPVDDEKDNDVEGHDPKTLDYRMVRAARVVRASELSPLGSSDPAPDTSSSSETLKAEPAPGLPRGRVIELSGGARTTVAVQILLEAQHEGDLVAWVQPRGAPLFPPDLARAGLDLDALLVVHLKPDAPALPKAAELILRTGAFGALVIDYTEAAPPRGAAWLNRLSALSREHDCRCVLLSSDRSPNSMGPMVSLRLRIDRQLLAGTSSGRSPRLLRIAPAELSGGQFEQRNEDETVYRLRTEVLKNKSGQRPALPGPIRWYPPEGFR